MFESLEPRRLFAHIVKIMTQGHTISVLGSHFADNIVIQGDDSDGSGFFQIIDVTAVDRTTRFELNGVLQKSTSLPFDSKGFTLNVSLVGGDDTLTLDMLPELKAATIDSGSGRDDVRFSRSLPSLSATGGDGNDSMTFESSTSIAGNLSVLPGGDRDSVDFQSLEDSSDPSGVAIAGKFQLVDTQGVTEVTARHLTVGRETSVVTGNSNDRLHFFSSTFGRTAVFATHGGDDNLDFSGSTFAADRDVVPGTGDNTVFYTRQ